MTDPANTHALVTGAAQGVGEATAVRLIAEGVSDIALLDINAEGLAATAERLERSAQGRLTVRCITADLLDIDTACDALSSELDSMGKLDVMVNAAGITSRGGLADITVETFDRLFAINVRAPLFLMQSVAPRIRHGGTIVNITSMLAYGGPPFLLGYSASKSALVTLTRGTANTLKREGVRVFGINLGWTWTPAEQQVQTQLHGMPENWREEVGAKQPFGRLLMPEDPAGLVAFLCSTDATMMTGAIIDLDQYVAGTVDDNPGNT